jgi:hypothetical protein
VLGNFMTKSIRLVPQRKILSKIQRRSRILLAVALASMLVTLAGCTQTTEISGTLSTQSGASVTVKHVIKWDPPGSYLASFDATQALLNLSLANATISSTSGTVNVKVVDLTTNQIIGQQAFGYVVNGTSVYAQDPTSVYNWLQQFTGYANIDVVADLVTNAVTTGTGTASVTGTAQYQGSTYASSTVSWEYTGPTDGQCQPGTSRTFCPRQINPGL